MPRDIPLGNGTLQVAFDEQYRLRDLYYPDVGAENHVGGAYCRTGVWVDGQFAWLYDDAWQREQVFEPDAIVTQVTLRHDGLQLELTFNDLVDFDRDVLLRRCCLHDLSGRDRQARLFFHHDMRISEYSFGDTAYYDPEPPGVCHYKRDRWFLLSGRGEERVGPDQWACGMKEIAGEEGTWKDAEDGQLSGNPVQNGSVDSVLGFHVKVPANGKARVDFWLCAGRDYEEVEALHTTIVARGPDAFLARTRDYWKLWVNKEEIDFGDLPPNVVDRFKRSLLVLRTNMDSGGALVAATDTDIIRFGQDVYTYVWPRDGAFAASALADAGYDTLAGEFFRFCSRVITRKGYFLHKYNADGTYASSWLPWVDEHGKPILPIQEDETALVIWGLWRHFDRYRDVEFVKPLFAPLIRSAADFLVSFRDSETRLPNESVDLWEERRGVHVFTVASVIAGLRAAAEFMRVFGDSVAEAKYRAAEQEVRLAMDAHLWSEADGRYCRMARRTADGYDLDMTVDSANAALLLLDVLPVDHPHLAATMEAIEAKLTCQTDVGGVARYENDYYQQVSKDVEKVPGNPWFVCTLWVASWHIARAQRAEELTRAREMLTWAADRALPSGILAEQIHPYTGAPLSVSPLVWSHATMVTTVLSYLQQRRRLLQAARGEQSKRDTERRQPAGPPQVGDG